MAESEQSERCIGKCVRVACCNIMSQRSVTNTNWSLGGESEAEIRGTNKSAETCVAPHTVVSETWDTLYRLLMRFVGHLILVNEICGAPHTS
jgi:hypothetical protein